MAQRKEIKLAITTKTACRFLHSLTRLRLCRLWFFVNFYNLLISLTIKENLASLEKGKEQLILQLLDTLAKT